MHILLSLLTCLVPCVLQAATCTVQSVAPAAGITVPDTRSADTPFAPHVDDLSLPSAVQLTWTGQGTCAAPSYTVYVSADSIISPDDTVTVGITATEAPVWNLKTGTDYYWTVTLNDNGRPVGSTAVAPFNTPAVWPRMIRIDGTTNARDIGGRTNRFGSMIRQGIYYRSAEIHPTFAITALGLRQVRQLGIRCEIDLRGSSEDSTPALPPDIRYYRVCGPGEDMLAYRQGILDNADKYRDVFSELARRVNYPLLIHCHAGMDRAGTVTAILEAVLECTEEQILLDYQWSSLSVYGLRGTEDAYGWVEWNDLITELKSYDTQNGTLQEGARRYLLSIGITTAELDSLTDIFLEKAVSSVTNLQPHPAASAPSVTLHTLLPGITGITLKGDAPVRIYTTSGALVWKGIPGNGEAIRADLIPDGNDNGVYVICR